MQVLIRKIARFSRASLAALAVIGIGTLTLFALFGEKVLKGQVESRLSSALGRSVTVGSLSVNLPGRVVELRDVLIPGLPRSKRPTFAAPRVRVALSFRSFLAARIRLRGLELARPRFSVQVFPDGSTDLPKTPNGADPSSLQLSIEKLIVAGGDLFLNDQQIPLELAWPHFEASLVAEGKNLLKGDLRAGPGPLRIGDLPAQDGRFEIGVRFADSTLHIDQGTLSAQGSNLSLAGKIHLQQAPQGEIRITGPIDLETFDRSVVSTGFELKGRAQSDLLLSFDAPKLALTGNLRGENGAFHSIPVDAFATGLSWDGSNLNLKGLALMALGGNAVLDVEVPAFGASRVTGTLESLSTEPLLQWLFDYRTAGIGSRVSGPIDLSFPPGSSDRFSGTGDLQFLADPRLGDPFGGRLPFEANAGLVTFKAARFEAPRSVVTMDGSMQTDRRLSLAVDLHSEDLGATDALGVRLRTAFGAAQARLLGATGRGRLDGHVSGTINEPVFSGRFSGSAIRYVDVPWGDVEWVGSASTLDLKSERMVAKKGASRLELTGAQGLGASGINDFMDLEIAIRDWPARDLLHVVESPLAVDSNVSGSLRLLGTRSKPLGQASLTSSAGKASEFAFAQADLKLKFEEEVLRIESLQASLGGGQVTVKGVLTDQAGEPALDADVEFSEVELSDLGLQEGKGPMIGGHVTGRATLRGPTARPRVSSHFESNRIFFGEEGVGAMVLDVEGSGDGMLTVTGRSDSPRFRAAVSGSVEVKAPHQSRFDLTLSRVRVDPVLRALGSRFEAAVVITASATAQVTGPLLDRDALTAQIREGRLRIALPDYALEAEPGFVIGVERSELRIAGLTLTGEGTSLSLSGKLAMKPDDLNDLAVTGRADLRVLSGFLKEWRVRGSATLRSQLGGSPGALRVSGGLDIEDGAVRLRTFPQGLDGLNGRIVFNETQARVAGLEGRFGGGRVSVAGEMAFGGAAAASFDFSFSGDSLGLRYPEGLRSTFGASLRLQGTTDSQWLTGELLVAKALWTRKYAITSELLSAQDAAISFRSASNLNLSPLHLDVAIKAPGTLRLDNNIASFAAKADLSLTGTAREPQLLGQVEVERGKVFFRGNTYDVRKGIAHFSNPRDINPVFDIEADTRVLSYRLTLQANGTLDRVSTRVSSDPPLTAPQIASLLTGGDENEVSNVGGSGTDLKALGTGGANSFASSWLDDNLTGKVAQGFGLSRLSIDPGKNLLSPTGSRLTVGKRVTRDLEVVYSRNLFGGLESQLATTEYSLSNRFSLVASWAEPGGFALDARTRITLGR